MELEHFPPTGSRFSWSSPTLRKRPWVCNIAEQMHPTLDLWPLSVLAFVNVREDGTYVWGVEVIGWQHERKILDGKAKDGLSAILAAEQAGVGEIERAMPEWVKTALVNGWRPPHSSWKQSVAV